ncbi:DUF5606 family protein [Puia dinghuensis]|uniref:DUF5606 domain-containing protein n=1 Tax=Puia dinghuensis TaxID=1792502 RepID=A0A8J2XUI9_9BACT|nr:DUF5606 domain-containing protein [Puia dinghuensis]GGB11041.1 hypothetical protein GCM10011511_38280 [Puia dinghuensis]
MEYNKIIAVTGMPGLYELLSSKSDGAIVRSLDDKTTRFVASRSHNFSHLESIEVYTVRDNVNLVDVLKAMEASPEKLPDEKDNAALKAYFTKVYPDLDFERVYSSDLKKMVKWFSVLKTNNIEIKLTEPEPEEEAASVEVAAPAPEEKEEKPAPAKKAVKAAKESQVAEKESPAAKEAPAAEKPKAKKAAPKKKAEEEKDEKIAEKPKKVAKKKS